jgi:hypothetical protein
VLDNQVGAVSRLEFIDGDVVGNREHDFLHARALRCGMQAADGVVMTEAVVALLVLGYFGLCIGQV